MANEVLIQDVAGSSLDQICFAVSGSLSPADSGTDMRIGTPTYVALTLAGVANAAGRQSAKCDFGAVRARKYALFGCVDYTGETPVAGQYIDYYWAPSTHATAGNGNIAGNSGGDADAPDGAIGSITLAEFKGLCIPIGRMKIHDGACVQNGFVGYLYPPTRYGQLLVINEGDDTFEDDDVEMHQVLCPVVDEIQ